MIIYPNTVKRQGNVLTGVITLVIAPFDFGKGRFRGGKRIAPKKGVLTIPIDLASRDEVLFEIK